MVTRYLMPKSNWCTLVLPQLLRVRNYHVLRRIGQAQRKLIPGRYIGVLNKVGSTLLLYPATLYKK
jgi:hypothetical protein